MNTIEYRNNTSGINNLEPIWKNKRKNVFRTEINFLFLCLFSGVVKTDLSSHNHKYFINPSGEDLCYGDRKSESLTKVKRCSRATGGSVCGSALIKHPPPSRPQPLQPWKTSQLIFTPRKKFRKHQNSCWELPKKEKQQLSQVFSTTRLLGRTASCCWDSMTCFLLEMEPRWAVSRATLQTCLQ